VCRTKITALKPAHADVVIDPPKPRPLNGRKRVWPFAAQRDPQGRVSRPYGYARRCHPSTARGAEFNPDPTRHSSQGSCICAHDQRKSLRPSVLSTSPPSSPAPLPPPFTRAHEWVRATRCGGAGRGWGQTERRRTLWRQPAATVAPARKGSRPTQRASSRVRCCTLAISACRALTT